MNNTLQVNRHVAKMWGSGVAVFYAALTERKNALEQLGLLNSPSGKFSYSVEEMEEDTGITPMEQFECLKIISGDSALGCCYFDNVPLKYTDTSKNTKNKKRTFTLEYPSFLEGLKNYTE